LATRPGRHFRLGALGDVSLLLTVTLALGFAFWPATPTVLAASAVTITTPSSASSPPNATVGSSYSFALDASGGDGQYTWSIASGGLPPGLALSTSGVISGTPTVVSKNGTFVAAVRSGGEAASQAFTIWANPAPPSPFGPGYCVSFGAGHISAAAAANLPNFDGVYACGPYYTPAAGTPYDEDGNTSFQCVELSARFLSAIYGITLGFGKSYQGNSVNGWNLVAYIGSKYGIPIGEPGSNSNVPQPGDIMSFGPGGVTGSAGHTAVVIKSNPGSFVIMSENMSNAIQDGTSGEQLVYVNGEHPSSVEFARSLSGGYTGVWTTASWLELAGTVPTPTASANALPTPAVSPPQTARIFEITTASTPTVPPNATVGRPYSFTLAATAGFEGPYLWSLAKGSLPPGLTLRKDGVISGTPRAVSRGRPVTVAVSDASSRKAEKDFTIWAGAAPKLSITTSAGGTPGGPPNAPFGRHYSFEFTATGGTGRYQWTLISTGVAGDGLPPGLKLSGSGVVSGIPLKVASAGTFTLKVLSGKAFASKRFTIKAVPDTVLPTVSACSLLTQAQVRSLLGSSPVQTFVPVPGACNWWGSLGQVSVLYGPTSWAFISRWFAHDSCSNQVASYLGGVGSKALTCPGEIDVLSGGTGVELTTSDLPATPSTAVLTSLEKYILNELGL
jgi:hypothetical protein